jgi:hypothetical protein
MPSRHRRIRPYRPSGLYRAGPPTAQQQQTGATLRDQLIADKGGPEAVTTAESMLIDLIIAAVVKHQDAMNYLRGMPRPWVNRRSQTSWRLVRDTTLLATHLQGLLRDLGWERRPQPIEDLTSYVARKDAEQAAKDTLPAPADPATVPESPSADHSSAQEQGAGVGSVQSAQRGSGSS